MNFVYSTREAGGFQLIVGPYLGIGLSGKQVYTVTATGDIPDLDRYNHKEIKKVTFAGNDGQEALRYARLDAGLNAGFGYKLGPWQVQATYGMGLVGINTTAPDSHSGSGPTNRLAQFTTTYFFARH